MVGTHLSSGFVERSDGRVSVHGIAARLHRWFGERLLQLATAAGAEEHRFGALIPRATLERAEYFDAFPDGAAELAGDPGRHAYCLSPAVCYHAYEQLAAHTLDRPIMMTAEGACYREIDRKTGGVGRLWEFTMREVIVIGAEAWVGAERDAWMTRVQDFAASLDLRGSLEPATDPFFGGAGRGKRLLQQLKALKYELRFDVGGSPLPVASFNVHETFFGQRFAMTLPDGEYAHSACVAFGLERWALAFLGRHGEEAAEALVGRDLTR